MEKAEIIRLRAKVLQTIRAYFDDQAFIEIDPPALIQNNLPESFVEPIYIQPNPATYAHGLSQLHTSPESYLKKLLGAGLELQHIYALGHVFRADQHTHVHRTEFMMLEWYRSEGQLESLVGDFDALVENLFRLMPSDERPPITAVWTMRDLFTKYTALDLDSYLSVDGCDLKALVHAATQEGLSLPSDATLSDIVDAVIDTRLNTDRDQMDTPIAITEWPSELASLATRKSNDPRYAWRVEIYWQGLELMNGFHELRDPIEQRQRFTEANADRILRGAEPIAIDDSFLRAIARMPACSGAALGVDRLMMLLAKKTDIKDVRF